MDIEQFFVDLTDNNLLAWKTAVAAFIFAQAGLQVALAARFWGGGGIPVSSATATTIHRWNGRFLLVLSVVLAYSCLFNLAGATSPARILAHSIAGTVLFVLLIAKFGVLHISLSNTARSRLPLLGTLLFVDYAVIWLLSAFDYVTADRVTSVSGALTAWVWVLAALAALLGGMGVAGFLLRRPSSSSS